MDPRNVSNASNLLPDRTPHGVPGVPGDNAQSLAAEANRVALVNVQCMVDAAMVATRVCKPAILKGAARNGVNGENAQLPAALEARKAATDDAPWAMEIPTNPRRTPKPNRAKATCPLAPHGPNGVHGESAVSPAERVRQAGSDNAKVATRVWAKPRGLKTATRDRVQPGPSGARGDLAVSLAVKVNPPGIVSVKVELPALARPRALKIAIKARATPGPAGPSGLNAQCSAAVVPETAQGNVPSMAAAQA